jgi:hypothetical protein
VLHKMKARADCKKCDSFVYNNQIVKCEVLTAFTVMIITIYSNGTPNILVDQ